MSGCFALGLDYRSLLITSIVIKAVISLQNAILYLDLTSAMEPLYMHRSISLFSECTTERHQIINCSIPIMHTMQGTLEKLAAVLGKMRREMCTVLTFFGSASNPGRKKQGKARLPVQILAAGNLAVLVSAIHDAACSEMRKR